MPERERSRKKFASWAGGSKVTATSSRYTGCEDSSANRGYRTRNHCRSLRLRVVRFSGVDHRDCSVQRVVGRLRRPGVGPEHLLIRGSCRRWLVHVAVDGRRPEITTGRSRHDTAVGVHRGGDWICFRVLRANHLHARSESRPDARHLHHRPAWVCGWSARRVCPRNLEAGNDAFACLNGNESSVHLGPTHLAQGQRRERNKDRPQHQHAQQPR
jgi:hypothetical protein